MVKTSFGPSNDEIQDLHFVLKKRLKKRFFAQWMELGGGIFPILAGLAIFFCAYTFFIGPDFGCKI